MYFFFPFSFGRVYTLGGRLPGGSAEWQNEKSIRAARIVSNAQCELDHDEWLFLLAHYTIYKFDIHDVVSKCDVGLFSDKGQSTAEPRTLLPSVLLHSGPRNDDVSRYYDSPT